MLTILLIAAASAADLSLRIEDLESDQGKVMCTLYADADTWLQSTGYHATVNATISAGVATCVFPDVASGTWAVSFIHDVNDNHDMDNNFLGLPTEPWGMSRDAPIRFGPPAFKDAAFTHPSATVQVAHPR